MAGGGENSAQGSGVSDDPGFVTSVLSPLMRVVGLGIASRGGALGPMLASGGDFIAQARDDRLRRDVYANIMPALLQGVTRSREMAPGVPGKPAEPGTASAMPPRAETAMPADWEPPAAEAIIPGRMAIPATPDTPPVVSTWQTEPTMAEALARLQGRGGPEVTRAIALQELLRPAVSGRLPTDPTALPSGVQDARDRARVLEDEGRKKAYARAEEDRRGPIFAEAFAPNAPADARGRAAAAGLSIHPPTPKEEADLAETQRRRALDAEIARRLRDEPTSSLNEPPAPELPVPQVPGMPPFSAFQPSPERQRSERLAVAAAVDAGDPKARERAVALLGGPDPKLDLERLLKYGQTVHALTPPVPAQLTAETVKLIASGAMTDPRLTREGAQRMIAEEEARGGRRDDQRFNQFERRQDVQFEQFLKRQEVTERVKQDQADRKEERKAQGTEEKRVGVLSDVQRMRELAQEINKAGLLPPPGATKLGVGWANTKREWWDPSNASLIAFRGLFGPIIIGEIDRGIFDEKGVRAIQAFKANFDMLDRMPSYQALDRFFQEVEGSIKSKMQSGGPPPAPGRAGGPPRSSSTPLPVGSPNNDPLGIRR